MIKFLMPLIISQEELEIIKMVKGYKKDHNKFAKVLGWLKSYHNREILKSFSKNGNNY